MNDFIKDATAIIGSLGLFSGLLVWLIKVIIPHFLSKEIEILKSELQKAHAIELEKIRADTQLNIEQTKAELQAIVNRKGILIDQLQKKRMEVIEGMFSSLGELNSKASLCAFFATRFGFDSKRLIEYANEVTSSNVEALKKFECCRLYLPTELTQRIENILRFLPGFAYTLTFHEIFDKSTVQNSLDKWEKELTNIKREIDEIEKHLRLLLGVDQS